MPTHEVLRRFWKDFDRLTPEQQAAFRKADEKAVADLERGRLRPGCP